MASFFVSLAVLLGANCFWVSSVFAQAPLSVLATAQQLRLMNDPLWASLLHYSQGRTHIRDAGFILSYDQFSLSAELNATINAFYSANGQNALCRFPARYYWLRQYIELPEYSFDLCAELREFETRAPAEKIAVVYVSENITQPSSMMGHLFLKISGRNAKAEPLEHAISFYTEAKTLNVPKLIYDSLIKGKKGFFTLSPYAEKTAAYLQDEQRNLWEIELQLSPEKLRIIQLHLYELKQTEFTYFFHRYNCATVINFIISLAAPELREPDGVWITPLDIAKKINNSGRVTAIQVQTANRWRLRMLQAQLSPLRVAAIKKAIERDAPMPSEGAEIERFLGRDLARAYNDYRLETDVVSAAQWRTENEKITAAYIPQAEFSIDLSAYKNPLKTPPDSQVWIGVAHQQGSWYLRTGFLPASHSLEDDNRQYFGETGLHLAALSLLTNTETGDINLESFELYAAESLVPYDSLSGGVSGRFALGRGSVYNSELELQQQSYIKGAIGYSYSLSSDVDTYALAGVGWGFAREKDYVFASSEVGMVIREVFDMKSIFSISQGYHYLGQSQVQHELSFTQAKYFNKNYALFFHATRNFSLDLDRSRYDLTLKKYF